MVRWLVAASLVWPLAMGAAVWRAATAPRSTWAAAVYLAASRVCHQRPERSFHTAGVQWPVCGRCAGLYLAAPFGAFATVRFRKSIRSRRAVSDAGVRWALAVASVPTAVTLALEWTGLAGIGNVARFTAALPLGAVLAFAITHIAAGGVRAIQVN
jgi:uncharacterized membrane protein